MLDAAIETVANSGERPIVHSDRGAHYRWRGWISRMRVAKLVRSMSRKACSPDNAACEGFFGRLKTEMFYHRNWQATTIEQFIDAVDSYIHWYNETRIKISLGALSPIEYRESLGLAGINQSKITAAPPFLHFAILSEPANNLTMPSCLLSLDKLTKPRHVGRRKGSVHLGEARRVTRERSS